MTEKKHILFIVNPISGTKKKELIPGWIEKYVDKEQFYFEILPTQYAGHATELSRAAADKNYFAVIAIGGDGTVNEVAQSLIQTETALGIIPMGSGNGLARELKIPLKINQAIQTINRASIKVMDVGFLNERPFFCAAGIGFEAFIAERFSKLKKRGFSSYIKEAMKNYLQYKPSDFEINGATLKALQITISNTRQYGNNAIISPLSKIDDGKIEINVLKKFNLLKGAELSVRLFNQTIHKSNAMQTFSASNFMIRQKGTLAHIDGEPIEIGNDIEISVKQLSLKVICGY